ncbi:MAG TPA: DUF4375 domain-containing protein [Chthoniobacter sp.]|nr:DUF4375 domain-containing protein [Chthoniobacter sp.]
MADNPENAFDVVSSALDEVYRGADSSKWSASRLSVPLFTVWAVEKAVGVICNGGSQYFFENDWPDKPPYSVFVEAFRRIGSAESADCLEEAVAMFPFDAPHLHYQKRREHMDFLREREGTEISVLDRLGERIMDLEDETFRLLARYIQQHVDSFPSAKEKIENR